MAVLRFVCLSFLVACAGSVPAKKLRLRTVDTSVRKPGNVAVWFVSEATRPDQIRVLEDGQPISEIEAKQTITSPLPVVHYSLVLVDLSGSLAPEYVQQAQMHVDTLLRHTDATHRVGVYAFDGSKQLMAVMDFQSGGASSAPVLSGISVRDPSTNLNGAIVTGLQVLSDAVSKAEQSLKFGTLVVLSDGTDRAKWVNRDDMLAFVDRSDVDLFVIGLGKELNRAQLERIGRGGTVVIEPHEAQLDSAVSEHFARIDAYARHFFLLSYCSPARAGPHELRIEARDPSGLTGRIEKSFSADGFGPGCDPSAPLPLGPPLQKPQRLRAR